jgi:hypothetical protein
MTILSGGFSGSHGQSLHQLLQPVKVRTTLAEQMANFLNAPGPLQEVIPSLTEKRIGN